eukprot:1159204-Pelagomonas_calceolata.AAC.3
MHDCPGYLYRAQAKFRAVGQLLRNICIAQGFSEHEKAAEDMYFTKEDQSLMAIFAGDYGGYASAVIRRPDMSFVLRLVAAMQP